MIESDPSALAEAATDSECRILAFCCNFCAYAAADLAGAGRMQYSANVRIVHVPCTGEVEVEHLLAALERGIDGVLVAGCLEGGCHFLEGNLRARRRIEAARQTLDEIGLGRERLRMINLSASEAPTFVARIREMVETVSSLGPNPLRASAVRKGLVNQQPPALRQAQDERFSGSAHGEPVEP